MEYKIKSEDEHFRCWFGDLMGNGYGSGEEHIVPVLKQFMDNLEEYNDGKGLRYDYEHMEKALGPAQFWLMLELLCHGRHLSWGTSSRFGWMEFGHGVNLARYVRSHTVEQMLETIFDGNELSDWCYPNACNCGERGYVEGRKCPNPFWPDRGN